MSNSIAERMPEGTRRLAEGGYPNIAALARCYRKYTEIDKALGYQNAAHHWFNDRNNPSNAAEITAGHILERMQKPRLEVVPPAPKPVLAQPADESVLMVICPPSKAAKVQKVLAMLGCEVEAV